MDCVPSGATAQNYVLMVRHIALLPELQLLIDL
jgi:hypothetical protein